MNTYAAILQQLTEKVASYPSQRQAALAFGVSQPYLQDVLRGKRGIGPKLLSMLGWRKVETYERVQEQ